MCYLKGIHDSQALSNTTISTNHWAIKNGSEGQDQHPCLLNKDNLKKPTTNRGDRQRQERLKITSSKQYLFKGLILKYPPFKESASLNTTAQKQKSP